MHFLRFLSLMFFLCINFFKFSMLCTYKVFVAHLHYIFRDIVFIHLRSYDLESICRQRHRRHVALKITYFTYFISEPLVSVFIEISVTSYCTAQTAKVVEIISRTNSRWDLGTTISAWSGFETGLRATVNDRLEAQSCITLYLIVASRITGGRSRKGEVSGETLLRATAIGSDVSSSARVDLIDKWSKQLCPATFYDNEIYKAAIIV